ncbi:hypothetical protein Tco_0058947 [Tanacetum coccineum]
MMVVVLGVWASNRRGRGEASLSIVSMMGIMESQTEITINPLGTLVKFRLAKSLHCEFPRYILRVPTSLSLDFATTSEWILSIHNEDRNPARATIETAHVGDSAGNPVKEILLKLNLPDHRILKRWMSEVKEFERSFRHSDIERLYRSDEVLKLRNFKKDATLKLSKSTNQEWVIGCLMYAMTCTRPDIAFAVGKVSRLTYTGYPLVLEEYTDASWISNTEDNSSTSGWIFLLGGGAIYWASKKQTCITGSTIEFEFLALASASNAATLAMAYRKMYNGKSRHLGVRHSMIRELITNGVVSIKFVRSQQNLADHLIKGLARDLVIKSAKGMGLKSN